MALLARLLPRDWDGRRLLQFLTGLALLALAFAAPAAPVAASESTVARGIERQDLCARHADRIPPVADDTTVLAGVTAGASGSRDPPRG
jgi:hypothetical protein